MHVKWSIHSSFKHSTQVQISARHQNSAVVSITDYDLFLVLNLVCAENASPVQSREWCPLDTNDWAYLPDWADVKRSWNDYVNYRHRSAIVFRRRSYEQIIYKCLVNGYPTYIFVNAFPSVCMLKIDDWDSLYFHRSLIFEIAVLSKAA